MIDIERELKKSIEVKIKSDGHIYSNYGLLDIDSGGLMEGVAPLGYNLLEGNGYIQIGIYIDTEGIVLDLRSTITGEQESHIFYIDKKIFWCTVTIFPEYNIHSELVKLNEEIKLYVKNTLYSLLSNEFVSSDGIVIAGVPNELVLEVNLIK